MVTDQAADDPYTILGVDRGATDQTIAAAYRKLARELHPDIAGEVSTDRMMRVNVAFDAIRTADRRVAWDEHVGWTPPPGSGPGTARKPRPADPQRRRPANDGTGGAGPPPGRPSGSVLDFGRHVGWSIGEIARVDPGYLDWLVERREGAPYAAEIEAILQRTGYRQKQAPPGAAAAATKSTTRRGRAFGRG